MNNETSIKKEKKFTALEYFYYHSLHFHIGPLELMELFQKALKMEQHQLFDAYMTGKKNEYQMREAYKRFKPYENISFEDYRNEIFGKDEPGQIG